MKRIFACIAIVLTAGILAVLFLMIEIHPETDRIVSIYQGKKAEVPSFHASLFEMSLDPYVAVKDHTDYDRPGEYDISYDLMLFSLPVKSAYVLSVVKDIDAPIITMEDGVICFSRINEPWSFPDYRVKDNYNTPEEISVTISGGADNTKEGVYEASLTACDSSQNCSFKPLTVVVGPAGEEDLEPGAFDLNRIDQSGIVLKPGKAGKEKSVYDELYWMGDSNILNLGKYDGVTSSRVLARYGMSPASFDLPLFYDNRQTNLNAVQLVSRFQPAYLILMMGEAEAGSGNPLALADHYHACIEQLREASPDTTIIVSSILPVCRYTINSACDQRMLNRTNYCLYRMCREHNIPMICADERLLGKDGWGNPEYYNEDGFHLRAIYFNRYTDYVKDALNASRRFF